MFKSESEEREGREREITYEASELFLLLRYGFKDYLVFEPVCLLDATLVLSLSNGVSTTLPGHYDGSASTNKARETWV